MCIRDRVWGVYPVVSPNLKDSSSVDEMTEVAERTVQAQGFAQAGQNIVISAGMPFAVPGTTNLLKIAVVRSRVA